MMRAAQQRGIPNVMLNTNGKRIATDDLFLAELAEVRPNMYFRFDGFDSGTYRIILRRAIYPSEEAEGAPPAGRDRLHGDSGTSD